MIDLAPRKRDRNFALRFTGWFDAPADDLYTFHITSDDGSRLWIGDTLAVDNDGAHAAQTRSGRSALQAGAAFGSARLSACRTTEIQLSCFT